MADDGRRGDGCRLAPGFVGGWLLGCRNSAKTASKILKLASEAAQTVRIFEATQISASQESAPLLQSPSTGSTRLTGVPFTGVPFTFLPFPQKKNRPAHTDPFTKN